MDSNRQENMWFGVISNGDTTPWAMLKEVHGNVKKEKRHNSRLSAALGGAVGDDNRELSQGFLRFINGDSDSFVRHTRIAIHTEPDSCLNYSTSPCS